MPMIRQDLSRAYVLTVCANGTVHIKDPGSAPVDGTLPVFSTSTREEAEGLRVLHCKLARDGSGLYFLNEPPKDVDDLGRVSDLFRHSHDRRTVRQKNARETSAR